MKRTVLALAGRMARSARIAAALRPGDPICRVLDAVLNEEQARAAAALRPGETVSPAEAAARCDMLPGRAQELLQECAALGVVWAVGEGYRLPALCPGLTDSLALSDAAMTADSENAYWLRKALERWKKLPQCEILPPDHPLPSVLLRQAEHIALAPSPARRLRRLETGQGCTHPEEDVCVLLGPPAEAAVRAGLAGAATAAEALAALTRAADRGEVLTAASLDGSGQIQRFLMTCVCYGPVPARPSVYRASLDATRCTSCGACVDRCPAQALTRGQSGAAPCLSACPLGVPMQSILRRTAAGDLTAAAESLFAYNPLPAATGAVCARPCETDCVCAIAGESVSVGDLERALSAQIPAPSAAKTKTQKTAVIGGGPAGLGCAAALARLGYDVTVFERATEAGGALRWAIPARRMDENALQSDLARLTALGVELHTGVTFGQDITLESLRADGYAAVCLAFGTAQTTPLKLSGADGEGVSGALEFLRVARAGEILTLTGDVAVLGSGTVALDAAAEALRLGAKRVSILFRRGREELKMDPARLAEAEAMGVRIMTHCAPKAILRIHGAVAAVETERMALSAPDALGRQKLIPTGERETVKAELVLHASNLRADWGDADPGAIRRNRNGTVVVDGFSGQTAEPDVFAAGDLVTGPRTAAEAIASGREAAVSMDRYLQGGQDLQLGREKTVTPMDPGARVALGASLAPCRRVPVTDDKSLRAEASRCAACGAVALDSAKCIGCGVCAHVCGEKAITMQVD